MFAIVPPSPCSRIALELLLGEGQRIQLLSDLRRRRATADNRIDSNARLHADQEARLDDADVTIGVGGLLPFNDCANGVQGPRATEFGAINLNAEAVRHVVKQRGSEINGFGEV